MLGSLTLSFSPRLFGRVPDPLWSGLTCVGSDPPFWALPGWVLTLWSLTWDLRSLT